MLVGSAEECEREAKGDVQVVRLEEGCAVPGLADAHGHPLLHGRTLAEVRLGGAKSAEECVARVAKFAEFVPTGGWIRGSGWDQNAWPGRGFPDLRYTLQIKVEDCTGCELCVEVCPARSLEAAGVRAINMVPKAFAGAVDHVEDVRVQRGPLQDALLHPA